MIKAAEQLRKENAELRKENATLKQKLKVFEKRAKDEVKERTRKIKDQDDRKARRERQRQQRMAAFPEAGAALSPVVYGMSRRPQNPQASILLEPEMREQVEAFRKELAQEQ